jgi:TorA maturation chaperone TorD
MTSNEVETQLDTILAGEVLFLNLLGRMVFTYPDPNTEARNWIQFLLKQDLFTEAPLGAGRQPVQKGLELLQGWTAASQALPLEKVMLELQADNTYLFACVGNIIAPPWESVYFNKKRLVYQTQMLEVRSWYRHYGLVADKLFVEADDHIGLELIFVAYLSNQALKTKQTGDVGNYDELVAAQRQFLSEHLLLWGGLWCDQVIKYARTDYYRGIALLIKGCMEEVAEVFQR